MGVVLAANSIVAALDSSTPVTKKVVGFGLAAPYSPWLMCCLKNQPVDRNQRGIADLHILAAWSLCCMYSCGFRGCSIREKPPVRACRKQTWSVNPIRVFPVSICRNSRAAKSHLPQRSRKLRNGRGMRLCVLSWTGVSLAIDHVSHGGPAHTPAMMPPWLAEATFSAALGP